MSSASLEFLRYRVLGIMSRMDALSGKNLQPLAEIPLALIRKNATRLHGACRFKKGVDKWRQDLSPLHVKEVALHPESLNDEWLRYAEFLMFHEFLHALGHGGHDQIFRNLEAQWPDKDAKQMGINFTRYLRQRNAKFAWTCPKCSWKTERSIKSGGRYLCRKCKVKLVDCAISTN
ncbi:MAG: hypothetical protein HOE69_03540 [Euryarchaeota archaeon]|jgi:predicted RNA-binding Zn-ribbon protein involved in translation (DUF1610 family)|nr:hypothetical protein [Euryarchaeota archaeon]